MKYCVNTYSFGAYGNPDRLGIYGMIDKAAQLGYDGIEFTESYWLDATDPELAKIGGYVKERGLEAVSLCVGADLLNRDSGTEIRRVCRLIDKAKLLGASMLRHDASSGFVTDRKFGLSYADALPRLAEACRKISEYGKSVGIKTMTENHGYFSQDADRVEALINAAACDNFGALIDLGNFMCADEDPTVSVGKLARYAFHAHAKDFLYKPGTLPFPGDGWFRTRAGNFLRGTIIGHGEAKIWQSLGILKRSGYNGWLSVEFEGLEDNLTGIKMGLDNLKRLYETA